VCVEGRARISKGLLPRSYRCCRQWQAVRLCGSPHSTHNFKGKAGCQPVDKDEAEFVYHSVMPHLANRVCGTLTVMCVCAVTERVATCQPASVMQMLRAGGVQSDSAIDKTAYAVNLV